MNVKEEIKDLIERMEICLSDDFYRLAKSDLKNWIIELNDVYNEI